VCRCAAYARVCSREKHREREEERETAPACALACVTEKEIERGVSLIVRLCVCMCACVFVRVRAPIGVGVCTCIHSAYTDKKSVRKLLEVPGKISVPRSHDLVSKANSLRENIFSFACYHHMIWNKEREKESVIACRGACETRRKGEKGARKNGEAKGAVLRRGRESAQGKREDDRSDILGKSDSIGRRKRAREGEKDGVGETQGEKENVTYLDMFMI